MAWARWLGPVDVGVPEIIFSPKGFRDTNGISYPSSVFTLWTATDLATVDWYEYIPDTIPKGEELVSTSYSQSGLQILEVYITQLIPLADAKTIAIKTVENQAKDAREQWISLTPGYVLTLNSQMREIDRWGADGAKDPVNYARARAEAARTNKVSPPSVDVAMLQGVIDIWKDAHTTWEDASITIEDIKEVAIEDINGALTNAEVQAIVDAIVWPAP